MHDFAADILKIDIDAVGRRGGEFFFPVGLLVVDGRVKTEILGEPATLFVVAGDTDDAAALNLPDLTGDAARGAGGGGDHQRLAFVGLRDFHSEKSGEAVDAQNAEENRV